MMKRATRVLELILPFVLCVFAVMTLIACGDIAKPPKLGSPTASIVGDTLSWTAVDGARGYIVETNGSESYGEISGTEYSVADLTDPLVYVFRVRALAPSGSKYWSHSDWSNAVYYSPNDIDFGLINEYNGTLMDAPAIAYEYSRSSRVSLPSDYDYEYPDYIDDEVIKYRESSYFTHYDRESNLLINVSTQGSYAISTIDADTTEWKYRHSFGGSDSVAIGEGQFVIVSEQGHYAPLTLKFTLYDLKTNTQVAERLVENQYYAYDPILCGNVVMYDAFSFEGGKQTTILRFVNIITGATYETTKTYGSYSLVNYNENIVYFEQSDNTYITGESTLTLVDVSTGLVINSITSESEHSYSDTDLALIGEGLLMFNNRIYDAATGELVRDSALAKDYCSLLGFTPVRTLHTGGDFDIVYGRMQKVWGIAVFDNRVGKYVYAANSAYRQFAAGNNGKYFLYGSRGWDNAMLDTTKITGVLRGNMVSRIAVSFGGKTAALCFDETYTDAAVGGGKLFVAQSNRIIVFDAQSLAKERELEFDFPVLCLDADESYLAVGFGGESYMVTTGDPSLAVVSLSDWEVTIADAEGTDSSVFDLGIYKGIVYFTGQNYRDNIFEYKIATGAIAKFPSFNFSQPYITIDKGRGIMYIGQTGISSSEITFFDLATRGCLHESAFMKYSYTTCPPVLGGDYVHYDDELISPTTGKTVSQSTEIFKVQEGAEFLGGIYSDLSYVFWNESAGGKIRTVAANRSTGDVIEMVGESERVVKISGSYFIIRPGCDTVYRIG